jgi:copper(I)-binding protein
MHRLVGTALLAVMLAGTPAWADTGPAVEQPWARATVPTAQTGAAYLTVHSATPDQITGFSTPVAASATLHQSMAVNGVMEMRVVASLPVGPGQDVTLSPGGYHVMLMGLKHGLKPGDHFPLTVIFAHAAPVTADVTVGRAGASGPGMAGMDMSGPAKR